MWDAGQTDCWTEALLMWFFLSSSGSSHCHVPVLLSSFCLFLPAPPPCPLSFCSLCDLIIFFDMLSSCLVILSSLACFNVFSSCHLLLVLSVVLFILLFSHYNIVPCVRVLSLCLAAWCLLSQSLSCRIWIMNCTVVNSWVSRDAGCGDVYLPVDGMSWAQPPGFYFIIIISFWGQQWFSWWSSRWTFPTTCPSSLGQCTELLSGFLNSLNGRLSSVSRVKKTSDRGDKAECHTVFSIYRPFTGAVPLRQTSWFRRGVSQTSSLTFYFSFSLVVMSFSLTLYSLSVLFLVFLVTLVLFLKWNKETEDGVVLSVSEDKHKMWTSSSTYFFTACCLAADQFCLVLNCLCIIVQPECLSRQ